MALPLYQSVQQSPPLHDAKRPSGNCGLWFERFYDRYADDFSETKDSDNAFKEWLAKFDHLAGETQGLDEAINRQSQLVKSLGGTSALYKTDWHFVTGMGNPHPLENGFNWHPVWGVPYLPGSGLKGLVRAWVEAWEYDEDNADEQEAKKRRLQDWFGSDDKDPTKQSPVSTGKLIFFDAVPYKPVRLVSDIMTPHMGDWYAKGGELQNIDKQADVVPADWHSPTPIYFLAAKEPLFLVSVAPRNDVVALDVDMAEVMQCLGEALEWLGAGAKTAVGYGQLYHDVAATERHEQAVKEALEAQAVANQHSAQLAGLAGIALELVEYSQQAGWADNSVAFTQAGEIEAWLGRLETEHDKQAVAFLETLFNQHFKGLLADPDKTKGKKNKPVFNARQRSLAERMLSLMQD